MTNLGNSSSTSSICAPQRQTGVLGGFQRGQSRFAKGFFVLLVLAKLADDLIRAFLPHSAHHVESYGFVRNQAEPTVFLYIHASIHFRVVRLYDEARLALGILLALFGFHVDKPEVAFAPSIALLHQ